MLTISKPLSATQAQTYHAKEFTAAEQNYWKQGDTIQGEWHQAGRHVRPLRCRESGGVLPSLERAAPGDWRAASQTSQGP
jgi:hypothetical protein